MAKRKAVLPEARSAFHAALLNSVLTVDTNGVASNADKANKASVEIARGIIQRIGVHTDASRLAGQSSGHQFEGICAEFIRATFSALG
ncbi:MAG TPA: NgoMIV family type II restriction endonuclease, partial [Flavobacteriales bacterium]|nr:NgoMIV family type II restriction endonuclease [Flavobacteriales bacterium]